MTTLASEFEFEAPALGAFELEGELEHEQFFGKLASLARTAGSSPALRNIGMRAARSCLANLESGQGEHEFESEFELELEFEGGGGRDSLYSPIRKVYPDALMEHMAHQASMAESEQEAAEAFLPLIPMLAAKLAPLAIKALPMIGKVGAKVGAKLAPKLFQGVMKVAPQMTRGIGQLAKTLYRSPQTRPLLRAVPAIARRTTAQLARQMARGRAVTPKSAVRTLARQASRTLSNPTALVQAYRRGRRGDQAVHRMLPGAATPRAGAAATRAALRQAGCTCGAAANLAGQAQSMVAQPAQQTSAGCQCGRATTALPVCASCGR